MQGQQEGADQVDLFGCLTYQSLASAPPSDNELNELVARARLRNQSVGVTGMLLYEDGRFLQTLEGPPAGLSAVWASIQQDERHQNIEVLTEHYAHARLFSDWDLLLYRKREHAPRSLWERLRRRHPLGQYVQRVVRDAFDANEAGLGELFARLASSGWHGDEVVRQLIEPAARAMGDAWLADDCTEFDLTLGLGILQMAGHAVRYSDDVEQLRSKKYRSCWPPRQAKPIYWAPPFSPINSAMRAGRWNWPSPPAMRRSPIRSMRKSPMPSISACPRQ